MTFDELQDEVFSICEKERPAPKTGDSLFHYTDSYALLNILKKNELWVTQREFMNDVFEMSYADSILKQAFKINYNSKGEEEYDRFFHRNAFDVNKQYIFSLTTEKDLISQWSYYGKNDGYSLEFKVDDIFPFMKRKEFSIYSGNVVYKKENQLAIFTLLLRFLDEKDCELKAQGADEFKLMEEISNADSLLVLFHSLIKQENNYPEKEYRFVYNLQDKICFRSKNGIITPYVEISVNDTELPIKKIMIGPRASDIIAQEGLKQYIDSLKRTNEIETEYSAMRIR